VDRLNAPLTRRLREWRRRGIRLPASTSPGAAGARRFWLKLPSWLAGRGRSSRRRLTASMLRDIQSGQYALFLFARLHDDVVDDAATVRATVYAGDDLLMEAERQFARHLGEDPWFWRHFRACVSASVQAVAELDQRQRRPGKMNAAALPLYGRLGRLLLVGGAAACAVCDRRRDFTRIVSFGDELAIAGQILDDLLDVDEDLQRGRFNFAATRLGIDDLRGSAASDGRLGRSVLIDDAIGVVLGEADRHLRRAAHIAGSLKLDEAVAHVERLRADSRAFWTAVRQTRVEQFFAELLAPARHVGAGSPARRRRSVSSAPQPSTSGSASAHSLRPGRRGGIIRRTAAAGGES